MSTVVRTYVPSEKGQAFHASPAKYRLIMGAYGAAKTTMLCWEDILLAQEYPGSLGVIFRRTYPALRDTTQRSYLAAVPPELVAKRVKSEGREEVEYTNGSRTLFRCLDDPLKLGSTEFDRVGIDEAGEVPEPEFRTLAFGRLRGRIGPRRMVLATNPVDETHWLYKFFVAEADEDVAVFHFSTYDNREHLPAGYIERLEKLRPSEKRMYLHGLWGVQAKGPAVFPSFVETLHTGTFRVIPTRPVIRGWDPGFYRPACVWMQADPLGRYAILHELLGDAEDTRTFANRVVVETKERFPTNPCQDYCDVAGVQRHDSGDSFVGVLKKHFGIYPFSRKLDVAKSIQGVRDLLNTLTDGGVPMLRVDTRCRLVARAFAGGYHLDKRGVPVKDGTYDHLMDAARYALAPAIQPLRSLYEGRALPRRHVA